MFTGRTNQSGRKCCGNRVLQHLTSLQMHAGYLQVSKTPIDIGQALPHVPAFSFVNKNAGAKPDSVLAYASPQWRGKTVMANPLFGTTTAEIAALFVLWGDERAQGFMAALKANAVKLSPSNGDSADLVANGEFAFGLVDSDDVVSRRRQHL